MPKKTSVPIIDECDVCDDVCDECRGVGYYFLNDERVPCVCSEDQTAPMPPARRRRVNDRIAEDGYRRRKRSVAVLVPEGAKPMPADEPSARERGAGVNCRLAVTCLGIADRSDWRGLSCLACIAGGGLVKDDVDPREDAQLCAKLLEAAFAPLRSIEAGYLRSKACGAVDDRAEYHTSLRRARAGTADHLLDADLWLSLYTGALR